MTSPLYLLSIVLLVVNDLWLKYAWPGVVTGKLSDVAGLFAFAVFCSWITRRPALACSAVAAFFIWWKSPASQPVLDALSMARVVDATDLIALAVLPFAYRHSTRKTQEVATPARPLIAMLSLVAFLNTSTPRHYVALKEDDPMRRIEFSLPLDHVVKGLKDCGFDADYEFYADDTFVFIRYDTRAIAPRRHVSIMTKVLGREPAALEIAIWRVAGVPEAGSEEAVRGDFRARMVDCFGERITSSL